MGKDRFDLFDFRLRVAGMYARRDEALRGGEEPATVLATFRAERDRLFAGHPQSALDARQKASFRGLPYFAHDAASCVEAEIDPDVEPGRYEIQVSEREIVPLEATASLSFLYGGYACRLTMYWIDLYGGGLFLPFRDATGPEETYGGGRYLFDTIKGSTFLWAPGAEGRRMLLDFNYAYNPSCAYNIRWVCPLAPRENHLPLAIRAGERRFQDT